MGNLIKSLQKKSLTDATQLSSLLRYSLLIARKLNIPDFIKWVENELNGYNNCIDLPIYRTSRGILQGLNPYRGWIPIILPEPKVEDTILTVQITQSIAEIEQLKSHRDSANEGLLQQVLTGSQEQIIQKMIDYPAQIRLLVPQTSLDKIINAVRNIILEWSMKLEEEGILGDDIDFSTEEKQIAEQSHHIHISNFTGFIGNITNSQVNQTIGVTKNDLNSLKSLLSGHGIDQTDLVSLESCLQDDPIPTQANTYGNKISAWLGNMISKAAQGTWKVSMDVACSILTSALNKYYGFD